MSIEWINDLSRADWDEITALYRAAPLGNKNPEDLKTAFTNSMFCCFAFDDGALVGAGRVLADGCDSAYLCDVAVMPSHQGKGVGKEIIERLVKASKNHKKIILYAVPGKEPFYGKFGFKRMTTAMAIFEDQAGAQARGYLSED